MEHLERAGIHSGDSISVYPTQNVDKEFEDKIVEYTKKYSPDDNLDDLDEVEFWASVHMSRTAITSLPENERRISIKWLNDRGFVHLASDLDRNYKVNQQSKCLAQ